MMKTMLGWFAAEAVKQNTPQIAATSVSSFFISMRLCLVFRCSCCLPA